ncbi:MAG: hypothetical protein B7X92_13830 [Novosphingobium sp. 17-62-9]|nr:MAG: hypothetical protein B7X92_13830 [Novosphingobium sp. 17-62-9]
MRGHCRRTRTSLHCSLALKLRTHDSAMALSSSDNAAMRARLVDVAQAMIEERGGAGLNLSELAARAGISQANLSRYFETREDLMEAIADHWFQPMVAIMEEVLASDLPPRRKLYEFFARRFVVMRKKWEDDPVKLQTYIEVGSDYFEQIRSYIDLADHYLGEIIGEAISDGAFAGLDVDETISLVNQMCAPYCDLQTMTMLMERLSEDKLARIIDAVFDGLSATDRGAKALTGLRAA